MVQLKRRSLIAIVIVALLLGAGLGAVSTSRPPASGGGAYAQSVEAPILPVQMPLNTGTFAKVAEAISHLKQDPVLRDGLGPAFVDYYCRIKEAEIARFDLEVSEWEHREYFDLF